MTNLPDWDEVHRLQAWLEARQAREDFWLYELNEMTAFSGQQIVLAPIAAVGTRALLPPASVVLPLACLPLIWVISRRTLVSVQMRLPMRSACPAAAPASAPSWWRQVPGWLQRGLHAVGRVLLRVL